MKRAVILARVSTLRQEKEGLSIDSIQLPKIHEYIKQKGIETVREFTFSETADNKIRHKFNELLDFVKKHKDIEAIIVYRVDRITRNFRDAVIIDELMKEHNKEIHFVYDHLVLHKNSSGRDITDWDTKVYLAKQFLNRLREDAINSAESMILDGLFPGKGPFGYRNIKVDKKRSWIEPDPNKIGIVKQVYEWYASGSISMASIVKKIQEEYGIKQSKSQVHKMLKNKFYVGYAYRKDAGEYEHRYERIIPLKLFETVQKTIASHGKTKIKPAGIPFAYRGLIKCAHCGLSVTPERHKGGKYTYYHCTEYKGKHGAKWITEEAITNQLSEAFKSMQIPTVVLDDLTKSLKQAHDDKNYYYDQQKKTYQMEYSKIESRIKTMYVDKLDNLITKEIYKEKYNEFQTRLDQLQTKLDHLHDANREYYIDAVRILELASKAFGLFDSSEVEEKQLLARLMLTNLRLKDDKLLYDWVRPFDVVVEYASCSKWRALEDTFRNQEVEFELNKVILEQVFSKSELLSGA